MWKSILTLLMIAGSFGIAQETGIPDIADEILAGSDTVLVLKSRIPEGVLDLETAQRIALSENPSLEAAQARVRQAGARVRQALAGYFPSLDASASKSEFWFSDSDYKIQDRLTPGIDDSPENYRAGLTASWLLFDGFGREFQNAAARFGEKVTEAARQEAERLLLSAVANSYHATQLARETIAIAEADESFNLRQLKEAKARRRVGTGSLSDELNFEIRANQAKANLLAARRDYKIGWIGLAELMGLSDMTFPDNLQLAELEETTLDELECPDVESLLEYAQIYRPDVVQSRYTLEEAKARVNSRRAAFFPTLSASASEEGARGDHGRLDRHDFSTTVGVALNFNLFSGGRDSALYREAKEARTEAEKNLELLLLAVQSDVRQALENLKTAQEQLSLQQLNTQFTERHRDLVEKEYLAGQGSLVRLNEAQRDLTASQSQLAQAQVSLRQAWQNLKVASGQILLDFWEK